MHKGATPIWNTVPDQAGCLAANQLDGLFGAGDTIGGTAHKFSSGSFTKGRIAGKAAVKYVMEKGREAPQVGDEDVRDLERQIYQPLETYRVGRNEIVAGTVSPSYLLPIHGLQRLEKITDEYVGGISTTYMTNGVMLERGLEHRHAEGGHGQHGRRGPAPVAARLGTQPPAARLRVGDPPHALPRGDALTGLLLSRRPHEARRRELALLHALALRREDRRLADGEGALYHFVD